MHLYTEGFDGHDLKVLRVNPNEMQWPSYIRFATFPFCDTSLESWCLPSNTTTDLLDIQVKGHYNICTHLFYDTKRNYADVSSVRSARFLSFHLYGNVKMMNILVEYLVMLRYSYFSRRTW